MSALTLKKGEELICSFKGLYKTEEGNLNLTTQRVVFKCDNNKVNSVPLAWVKDNAISKHNAQKVLTKVTCEIKKKTRHLVFEFIGEKPYSDQEQWSTEITKLFDKRGSKGKVVVKVDIEAVRRRELQAKTMEALDDLTPLIETRASLLARDRDVKLLHDELVEGGVVSEEEFWQSRQAALRDEALSMEKQHTGRSTSEKGPKIPPPLHTYLPPSSSSSSAKGKETEADKDKGGNKEGSGNVSRLLNFTVDSTFMYNVFREFPAVKRAYQENVPDKISEKNFWSHYLRRQYLREQAKANAQRKHAHTHTSSSSNNNKGRDKSSKGGRRQSLSSSSSSSSSTSASAYIKGKEEGGLLGKYQQELEEYRQSRLDQRKRLLEQVDMSVDLTRQSADSDIFTDPEALVRSLTNAQGKKRTHARTDITQAMRKKRKKDREDMLRYYNTHGQLILDLASLNRGDQSAEGKARIASTVSTKDALKELLVQEKRRKQMALSATKSNKDNDNNNDNDSSINSSIGKGTGKDHGKGGVDHSKHKKAGGSLYRGESTVVGRGKMKVNEDLQREQSYMNALNVSLAHSDLLIKPKPRYHELGIANSDAHISTSINTKTIDNKIRISIKNKAYTSSSLAPSSLASSIAVKREGSESVSHSCILGESGGGGGTRGGGHSSDNNGDGHDNHTSSSNVMTIKREKGVDGSLVRVAAAMPLSHNDNGNSNSGRINHKKSVNGSGNSNSNNDNNGIKYMTRESFSRLFDDEISIWAAGRREGEGTFSSKPFIPTSQRAFGVMRFISNQAKGMERAYGAVETGGSGSASLKLKLRLQGRDVSSGSGLYSYGRKGRGPEAKQNIMYATAAGDKDVKIPEWLTKRLHEEFIKCNELQRHFWSCMPVNHGSLPKLVRMKESLTRCYERVQALRTKLNTSSQSKLTRLLDPMVKSLDKIFELYDKIEAKMATLPKKKKKKKKL